MIKEVPDENEAEEDVVAPTEIDENDLVQPSDIEEPEKFPFEFIEEVPVFPDCENLDNNKERKKCMSDQINSFVSREFNTGLAGELGLSGTNLVVIMFVVNEQVLVEQSQTRAPHPGLEKEAQRVIGKIPKMQPGRQRGKPVPVSFTIPVRFMVQD